MEIDRENPRILTYVTADHNHIYVRKISQEEGVRLVKAAGLFEACGGVDDTRGGPTIHNKFAAQVDVEKDLWVYLHDYGYHITTPRKNAPWQTKTKLQTAADWSGPTS